TTYRRVDPVAGEVHEALVVAPPLFANLPNQAFVFPDKKPKHITVRVSSSTSPATGRVGLDLPDGWAVTPQSVPVDLKSPNDQMMAEFSVTPPAANSEGTLRAVVSTGGRDFSFAREQIDYPHIGSHILMPPAEARIVRADIRKRGETIGYMPGAGDDIP